jgi:hypothetical protein
MSETATKPEAKKTNGPPYEPIRCVEVGDTVQWIPADGDNRNAGTAALVTEVGSAGVLTLTLFGRNTGALGVRSGVRHVSDPLVGDPRAAKAGCWRHSKNTKLLLQTAGIMKSD